MVEKKLNQKKIPVIQACCKYGWSTEGVKIEVSLAERKEDRIFVINKWEDLAHVKEYKQHQEEQDNDILPTIIKFNVSLDFKVIYL